jgi:hypothetical protein
MKNKQTTALLFGSRNRSSFEDETNMVIANYFYFQSNPDVPVYADFRIALVSP